MSPYLCSQIRAFIAEDRGVLEPPLQSDKLSELVAQLPFALPEEFKAWMLIANGACVSHGGVYGSRPSAPCRDFADNLNFYTSWVASKWLPVAWDGFGNEFALNCDQNSEMHRQVWFFEVASSEELPQELVAVSLEEFFSYFFSACARNGEAPPSQQRSDA